MGRGAAGVKGITLRPGDFVVEMDVLPPGQEVAVAEVTEEPEIESDEEVTPLADERGNILTVTEKGFGKRSPVSSYRLTGRGAMGVINIKTTDKNGKVAGIAHVSDDDQVLIISEQGMIIRFPVGGVRSMGRNTQGVRLINIEEGDRVVAAMKIVDKEQPEDLAAEAETVETPLPEPPSDDTVH
jgi:DNA gyrase subunit A